VCCRLCLRGGAVVDGLPVRLRWRFTASCCRFLAPPGPRATPPDHTSRRLVNPPHGGFRTMSEVGPCQPLRWRVMPPDRRMRRRFSPKVRRSPHAILFDSARTRTGPVRVSGLTRACAIKPRINPVGHDLCGARRAPRRPSGLRQKPHIDATFASSRCTRTRATLEEELLIWLRRDIYVASQR
jgi:hypothetical protein